LKLHCRCMLTNVDVCWRMLPYASDLEAALQVYADGCWLCWRMLPYADACLRSWSCAACGFTSTKVAAYQYNCTCLLVQKYKYWVVWAGAFGRSSIWACKYVCIYICMYYIVIYIYLYTHTQTHTHTHAYIIYTWYMYVHVYNTYIYIIYNIQRCRM
jgi:hypothetical protein